MKKNIIILVLLTFNSLCFSIDGIRVGSGTSLLLGSTNSIYRYSFLPKQSFNLSIYKSLKLNEMYNLNYELCFIAQGGTIKSNGHLHTTGSYQTNNLTFNIYDIKYKYNLNYLTFPVFLNKKLKKNNYINFGIIPGFFVLGKLSKIMKGNYPSNLPKREQFYFNQDSYDLEFMPQDEIYNMPFIAVFNNFTLSQSIGMLHKLKENIFLQWYMSIDYLQTINASRIIYNSNNSIAKYDILKARNFNLSLSLLFKINKF